MKVPYFSLLYWLGLIVLALSFGFYAPASYAGSVHWSVGLLCAVECFFLAAALDWIGRRALESFTLKHSSSIGEFRRLRALRDRERELRGRFEATRE